MFGGGARLGERGWGADAQAGVRNIALGKGTRCIGS